MIVPSNEVATMHSNPKLAAVMDIRLLQTLLRVRPAPFAVFLKRILRIQRVITETSTGRYWVDPVSNLGFALINEGSYEPGMQKTLARFLGPGKVFVDVGANEGYFTVQGAQLTSPGGRVIAVEPQKRLIPIIVENLHLNDLKNVDIVCAAISNETGAGVMHLAPNTNSGSSGLYRTTKYVVPKQKIKLLTLANVLEQHAIDYVDLVKMDIEGFEYEAILGSPRLFEKKCIKAMALELHPTILARRSKSIREIELFLKSAGYMPVRPFGNAIWLAAD
jgi:FkbM family methyltransferase